MMIDVPSLPNTQGHQGLPVVSLAFVGMTPPTDPQAVQERVTPPGACGPGRLPNIAVCASVEFLRLLGLTSSPTPPVAREPILAAFGGGPRAPSCPCLERSRSPHFCIVTLAQGRVGDALQGRSHGLLLPYLQTVRYPRRAPSTVQPFKQ